VELVLSEIYRTTYTDYEGVEVEVFNASLRLVSHQFRRVIDDSVPCFAMLKLLKSEYQRVSNSDGSIDSNKTSPWLTHSEVSMILSKRQIDLNEPLPEPRLMPLTALQIVASTMLCACYEKNAPDTELIYTVSGSGVFIQTIDDKLSPLHGKQIIVHQIKKKNHHQSTTCGLHTRFCVSDPEAASLLGIEVNTPYDHQRTIEFLNAEEDYETEVYSPFPQLRIVEREAILSSTWNRATHMNEHTRFNANMHYRRDKALWDRFPTLPRPLYRILARHDIPNRKPELKKIVTLHSLINMIDMFKLSVIFKSHTSAMLRQLYSSTIESHNVEHMIKDLEFVNAHELRSISSKEVYKDNMLEYTPVRVQSERLLQPLSTLHSLMKQNAMNLPVPLTAIDFERMVHILREPYLEGFKLTYKKQYRAPRVTIADLIKADKCSMPAGAGVYYEYNDGIKANIYYTVQLKRTIDHKTETVVVQLLRIRNKICFRMHIWLNSIIKIDLMREYDVDLAKEVFEYW
jgi:hypothetical protein